MLDVCHPIKQHNCLWSSKCPLQALIPYTIIKTIQLYGNIMYNNIYIHKHTMCIYMCVCVWIVKSTTHWLKRPQRCIT